MFNFLKKKIKKILFAIFGVGTAFAVGAITVDCPVGNVCIDKYDYVSERVEGSNLNVQVASSVLAQISDANFIGNVVLNIYDVDGTAGTRRGFQIISKTAPPQSILSEVATSTPQP